MPISYKIANLLTEAEVYDIIIECIPTPNNVLPELITVFSELVKKLINGVNFGETILIHGKSGRGSTGMLAAASLVQMRYSSEDAIASVRQVHFGALFSQMS